MACFANGWNDSYIEETAMNVLFVTAGEWPSSNGLYGSQVINFALDLKAGGHKVAWYSVVPLLSRLKRFVNGNNEFALLKSRCNELGLPFEYIFAPVTLGSPYSSWYRKIAHEVAGAKLADYALRKFSSGEIVFHSRSYYATEVSLFAKKVLLSTNPKRRVIVSFDMRSFLGPESPINFGKLGVMNYGFVKQLEYDLVRESDVSFLPVNVGRDNYFDESGLVIRYAPIFGLDLEIDVDVDFASRWSSKKIGYSGSIGRWHDPKVLIKIFKTFPDFSPWLAMRRHDQLGEYSSREYSVDQMPEYYRSLLGLVIPGVDDYGDYFSSLQMRTNLFSTKASEALSCGVPLIVSSRLRELSDFVLEKQCGLVIDVASGHILNQGFDVSFGDDWQELTRNAYSAGKLFSRKNVLRIYEQEWMRLLS